MAHRIASRPSRIVLASVLVAAVLATAAGAQTRLVTVDGTTVGGVEPVSIERGTLKDSAGAEHDLGGIRSIEYGRKVETPKADAAPFELQLASGDVVLGKVASGDSATHYLFLDGAQTGRVGFPYHRIDLLTNRANALAEPLPARREGQVNDDSVFFKKDGKLERLNGLVVSFTAEKVRFDWDAISEDDRDGKPITLSRIIAIRFGVRDPGGESDLIEARFHFVDGSRVTLRDVRLSEGTYHGKAVEGGESASFPASGVARVEVLTDQILFLSDEEPISVLEYDCLGEKSIFPWRKNRTVSGKSIRLPGTDGQGRVTYERGIGVHAYSRLAYDLHARYKRFQSLAALDAERPARGGSVVFRVIADGKVLDESAALNDPRQIHSFDVGIDGVRELVLEVDFASDLDLGDHAVWANAMVIRK